MRAPGPCDLQALPALPDTEVCISLSIKIAQKPDIIGSFGPKALNYESFEGIIRVTRSQRRVRVWRSTMRSLPPVVPSSPRNPVACNDILWP